MFQTNLAYLAKQLDFARGARTQVGLNDALARASDAIARLQGEAREAEERLAVLDAALDTLMRFTDGEVEAIGMDELRKVFSA